MGGHFSVYAQDDVVFGHGLKNRHHLLYVAYAGVAVGGSTGWIQLYRKGVTLTDRLHHIGRVGCLGQIQGHHGREVGRHTGLRQGLLDTLAIRSGMRCGSDRWHQIGHDQRALKIARARSYDRLQRLAIA